MFSLVSSIVFLFFCGFKMSPSFFKTSEKVTCLMGCNRCSDPIEGLKSTRREAQTHTHKPNLLVSPGNTLYPAVAQNHPTCKNFDLAFTKLQPIVSWYAIDIKTNGPISVKCLMTDRCVGFGGGFVWSDTCGGP